MSSSVRPPGWAVAFLAIACLAASAILDWQELAVVGLILAVVLLISVAFVLGGSPVTIDLTLATARVTVGERALGRLEARNEGRRATLPTTVELTVGLGSTAYVLPRIDPGDSVEEVFTVPTHRRAVVPVGPVHSVKADPFGLVRRVLSWADPVTLYVHPEIARLPGTSTGSLHDLEGRESTVVSDADLSFHALREYAPGDDLRRVHWLSTARTGSLMVRQYQETRRSELAVVLSARTAEYEQEEDFELAVSVCASLGVRSVADSRAVTATTSGPTVRYTTATRLLDDLAGVRLDQGSPGVVDLLRASRRSAERASVVVAVVGSALPAETVQQALRGFPADVRLLGLRPRTGAEVTVSGGGSATVVTLGALDELAGVVRHLGTS